MKFIKGRGLFLFIPALFLTINLYAQSGNKILLSDSLHYPIKNEFGLTLNINLAGPGQLKVEGAGCLGCGNEDITLIKKSVGLGQGIGLYFKRRLSKQLALNTALDINHMHGFFQFKRKYSYLSSRLNNSDSVRVGYGTEDYATYIHFILFSPNINLIVYLTHEEENKSRIYINAGLSASINLRTLNKGNLVEHDTIKTTTTNNTTLQTSDFTDFPILNVPLSFSPCLGVGVTTPENRKTVWHAEIIYQRYIKLIRTSSQTFNTYTLFWRGLTIKMGFAF